MRRRCSRPLLLTAVLLVSVAGAASAEPPSLTIPRVSDPPVLARYLDGTQIPPGVKVSGFKQREPGDGVDATVETDVYLSYDQKNLYAVYICRDDPAKVRANLTKRESIMGDDVVGLVLDTYRDGRRGYMFLVNPLGIQMDGVTTEGQDDDYSFDTVWGSEGRVTSFGFVVVIEIPFKSLRFSSEEAQTWGIAFARLLPRGNETSFWPYITRRIASVGQQLAQLEGLAGISPGRNLLVIPYGNFAADRVLGDTGYVQDRSARVGVDVKAVVKDAVTIDATLNPDFSQVESDEPQVTINQRFEVYFPEKRPFFIENAGYFETPVNLFFSRRIVDPMFGGRVTGKLAGWTVGGLLVNDDAPGTRVDDTDPRRDKAAGIAVARVQRDFEGQSHLAGMVTDREWGPTANRVLSADGRWKIDDDWSLVGQGVASRSILTEGREASGNVVAAEVRREARGFDYSLGYMQVSPDFQADLGFVRRRDMRLAETEADYTWFPKDSRLLSIGANLEGAAIWDYAGGLEEWTVEPGFEVELPGQTQVGLRHWRVFERFEGIDFRRQSTMVHASTEWLSWLNLEGHFERGTEVNYYPAEGLDPFLADSTTAEVAVTLKPVSRFRLDQSYLYARLSTRDDDGAPCACEPQGEIFTNHILRTRASYQFTPELSLRAIVDYETILPDQTLVDLEHERRFGLDILVTYLVNPWTAVYVGYTDAYENLQLGSPIQRPIGRSESATTSVGRQVFVKLSYLLRY